MIQFLKILPLTLGLIIALLFIPLIGCAKKPCLSLSEIDKQVNQRPIKTGSYQPSLFKTKLHQPLMPSPFRTSEEVLTVWVAPYQTQDGTYHEAKKLHFSVTPSTWLNTIYEIDHEDRS